MKYYINYIFVTHKLLFVINKCTLEKANINVLIYRYKLNSYKDINFSHLYPFQTFFYLTLISAIIVWLHLWYLSTYLTHLIFFAFWVFHSAFLISFSLWLLAQLFVANTFVYFFEDTHYVFYHSFTFDPLI